MNFVIKTAKRIRRLSYHSASIIFSLFQLLCRRDFYSLKLVHVWIWSLIRSPLFKHTPLNDEVPWVNFKAIAWLESYLKPNMSVFEYGSGGSTIFLARRIKKLISVEHDKNWYKKVSSVLSKEGISNCELVLCKPEKNPSSVAHFPGYRNYKSHLDQYAGMSFENYARSIEEYPEGHFDLVFIDGEVRSSCVFHALNKILPGGYLMFDNSDRPHHKEALSLLAGFKRTDFVGIGPYVLHVWQTSVWQIKS